MGGHFDLDNLVRKKEELEVQVNDPNFWNDTLNANKVNKELSDLNKVLDEYNSIFNGVTTNLEMLELIKLESDAEILSSLENEYGSLKTRLGSVRPAVGRHFQDAQVPGEEGAGGKPSEYPHAGG